MRNGKGIAITCLSFVLLVGALAACTPAPVQPQLAPAVVHEEPEVEQAVTVASMKEATSVTEVLNVQPAEEMQEGEEIMPETVFQIQSTSFGEGESIPERFTCSAEDVSPQLSWSGVPQGTRSFALVCNDPDAPVGNWIHWVIYNMPPDLSELPENVAKTETVAGIGVQGKNDSRKSGYNGPCPPAGKPHRYYFTLYALDADLSLQAGLDAAALYEAIDGHVLAQTEWMGTFQR